MNDSHAQTLNFHLQQIKDAQKEQVRQLSRIANALEELAKSKG